eukprot:gene9788-1764_t
MCQATAHSFSSCPACHPAALELFPPDEAIARAGEVTHLDMNLNNMSTASASRPTAHGRACPSSVESLAAFTKLQKLILDGNSINSIEGLPRMPLLETLWMNKNDLQCSLISPAWLLCTDMLAYYVCDARRDLEPLLHHLSKFSPKLTYLSVLGNPCCPNEFGASGTTDEYKRHRIYVVFRLPGLKYLDSKPVTKAEKDEAQRFDVLSLSTDSFTCMTLQFSQRHSSLLLSAGSLHVRRSGDNCALKKLEP